MGEHLDQRADTQRAGDLSAKRGGAALAVPANRAKVTGFAEVRPGNDAKHLVILRKAVVGA